jgi:hypothetical protein
MKIFFTILFACIIIFHPGSAYPWAGIYYTSEAHQYILKEAYKLLLEDPAFKGRLDMKEQFPSIQEILSHEGVNLKSNGPGPDGKGNSVYSEHYYNPVIKEGNAPVSIADYFTYLAYTTFYKNDPRTKQFSPDFRYISSAKNAAYAAHYLADLSVPYHVIGTDGKNIRNGTYKSAADLTEDVIGSMALLTKSPMQDYNDLTTEIKRFLETDDDYFAPFFYNGTPLDRNGTSSHALWEGWDGNTTYAIWSNHKYNLSGYSENPKWENPEPGFEGKIFKDLGSKAKDFAEKVAKRTRDGFPSFGADNYTYDLLSNSIRDVYTMWRASFSALRPSLDKIAKKEDIETGRYYLVSVSIMNPAYDNGKGEMARNVQVRVVNTNCGLTAGDLAPRNIGTVEAISGPHIWKLKPDKSCTLKLEAIGKYSKTPDLQYAMVEIAKLDPLPQKGSVTIEGPKEVNIGSKTSYIAKINYKQPPDKGWNDMYNWTIEGKTVSDRPDYNGKQERFTNVQLDIKDNRMNHAFQWRGNYTVKVAVSRFISGEWRQIGETTLPVTAKTEHIPQIVQYCKTSSGESDLCVPSISLPPDKYGKAAARYTMGNCYGNFVNRTHALFIDCDYTCRWKVDGKMVMDYGYGKPLSSWQCYISPVFEGPGQHTLELEVDPRKCKDFKSCKTSIKVNVGGVSSPQPLPRQAEPARPQQSPSTATEPARQPEAQQPPVSDIIDPPQILSQIFSQVLPQVLPQTSPKPTGRAYTSRPPVSPPISQPTGRSYTSRPPVPQPTGRSYTSKPPAAQPPAQQKMTQSGNIFYYPSYYNYRIDRCLNSAALCDKPAADRFCQWRGYAGAKSWKLEYAYPTYSLGDGKVCSINTCVGFSSIECQSAQQAPPVIPSVPQVPGQVEDKLNNTLDIFKKAGDLFKR